MLTPTNGEVFGTITNMQGFLQFPLITYCFIAPKASNPISRHLLRGVLAVAALTGPFSIICIALMALSFFGFLVLRVSRRSNLLSSATAYFEQRDFILFPAARIGVFLALAFAILEVFAAAHKFTVGPMLSLLHGDRYFFPLKNDAGPGGRPKARMRH